MSTSLRSDPDRRAIAKVLVVALMLSTGNVRASALDARVGVLATKDVQQQMGSSVRDQAANDNQLPNDRALSIRWLKQPFLVGAPSDQRAVGVVQLTFNGITNSYCRFVFSASDGAAPPVVFRLPEAANHDTCKGIRAAHSIDLDGDGLLDFAYAVKVRSNRYATNVEETIVFLGQADKSRPYCYSSAASRALAPTRLEPLAAAQADMSQALRQVGKRKFDCDPV